MLLKKTLNRFVLKKNPKKNDKPANALPLGRKGRLGFSVYAVAVLCFCCFSIPAFAASDPLGVVNNPVSYTHLDVYKRQSTTTLYGIPCP